MVSSLPQYGLARKYVMGAMSPYIMVIPSLFEYIMVTDSYEIIGNNLP
jgi:hypothetical protein